MSKFKELESKHSKLNTMALRGGTANERSIANSKLQSLTVVSALAVIEDEEKGDVYVPQGQLIRIRKGLKAYLRGNVLKHFLTNVQDGVLFSNRSIAMTEEFGSGDFYVVLGWLLCNNLAIKHGSKYEIKSRLKVVEKWNELVGQMRL